jgi:tRNA(Glu) U13 pseudouridine synthase TruD
LGLQDEDFLKNASLYCFKGQFRKMIVKPNKVEAKLVSHLNPKDELLSPFYTMGDEVKVQPGDLTSLVVILQLPKSSYATMAIRELLHVSSEFDVQM